MNNRLIRIAIVDDHPIVVEGLQKVLEQDLLLEEVFQFSSGEELINHLNKPESIIDVVLMDITLPGMNGVDACKAAKGISPETDIIAFSNHFQRSVVMQMLQNGATGYLLKTASPKEIVACIGEVFEGKVSLCKEVAAIMSRPAQDGLQSMPRLTKREKEIIKLIAEGKTSAEIGTILFISTPTVETHRRNIMQKFDVKNVAALIKVVVENGVV
jgi:DNA-binding NarL/FixJ family response regulator